MTPLSQASRAPAPAPDSTEAPNGDAALLLTARSMLVEMGLDPTSAEALLARARVRHYDRRESVWHEGQAAPGFVLLLSGRVKRVKADADGREVILDVACAGQLLCTAAPVGVRPYCCRAAVHGDRAITLAVARRELLELAERHPDVGLLLVHEAARCARTMCQRLEEVTAGRIAQRIARLLVRLARDVGRPERDGAVLVPVALSRQDLADLCATSVETAIRLMRRFEAAGVMDTLERGFRVRDRSALEQIAHGAYEP